MTDAARRYLELKAQMDAMTDEEFYEESLKNGIKGIVAQLDGPWREMTEEEREGFRRMTVEYYQREGDTYCE